MMFAPLFAIAYTPNIKIQGLSPTVHGECIGHLPAAGLEHYTYKTIQHNF